MTPAPNPERRNEKSRRAILDTTIELIAARSFAKVTIEAIAAAAGVGKQTIYRWWPSKGALAMDAINDRIGEATDFPDTGDIVIDLTRQMSEVVELLNGEIGTIFRGIIAEAQSDPALGTAILDEIIEPRTRTCEVRLAKAVAGGQLRSDIPTRVMVELLYSPLYYRILFGTDPLTTEYIPELLEYLVSGIGSD
ncbi:MAG TPA: TetR family transcriptional regulator [Micromonosporaceae bacterium]|nr:TetR family transcriptional regulator [Micromonosporaceae bacterium]HCU50589.1 TetR family transcriptional regulator [Micromonosporaceae bacterium]